MTYDFVKELEDLIAKHRKPEPVRKGKIYPDDEMTDYKEALENLASAIKKCGEPEYDGTLNWYALHDKDVIVIRKALSAMDRLQGLEGIVDKGKDTEGHYAQGIIDAIKLRDGK